MTSKNPRRGIDNVSLQLFGSFTPQRFHPAWFAAKSLIPEEEAEKAEIEILYPNYISFTSGEWLLLEVEEDSFIASATKPPYELLRDLVVSTFKIVKSIKPHNSYVRGLRLKRDMHFDTPSGNLFVTVGDNYINKKKWSELINKPVMQNMVIEGKRQDSYKGNVHVSIYQSNQLDEGICLSYSDYYLIEDVGPVESINKMVNIVGKEWDVFMKKSDDFSNSLLKDKP